jgi:RNA polymerase sigma-70 factor (ECF subfamily)
VSPDDSIAARSPADAEAFVRLFGKVQHGLRAFVLSLVPNWDEAEEIFQNSNLVLWRKFHEFDRQTDFRKWAFQVAYYEVLEWRRQRYRERLVLSPGVLALLADELTEDSEFVDAREQALRQCLETLPLADRQLVQLRYFADLAVQEIATQLGRSADAIYKATNRIRWRLYECIKRRLQQEGR